MPKTTRRGERSQDMRSNMKQVRYTKLHCGCWGLRTEGYEENMAGQKVMVTLRNGTQKIEKVGKAVWRGTTDRKAVGIYHITGELNCRP